MPPRHPPITLAPADLRAAVAWLAAALRGDDEAMPALPRAAWPHLAALAEGHGVAAMVLPAAERAAGPREVEAMAALRDAAARTRARGCRMAADQAAVHHALVSAGVPFAWLKGGWLAQAMPGMDLEARPRADLDVWVPPRAWPGAAAALESAGYRPELATWKHQVWLRPDNRALVDGRGEHPGNPRPVEVHGRLGEAFRGVWLDLEAPSPGPGGAPLPTPIAAAHMCAHATVSAVGRKLRLVQLADLAAVGARLAPADIEGLIAIGRRPGAARFLWPALHLARRHLSGAIDPAPLREPVKPYLASLIESTPLEDLGWPGAAGARRALLEVPRAWPVGAREAWAVWRFILWPRPEELADRYPQLAASGQRAAMARLHLGYSLRGLLGRLRRRA